MKPLIIYPCEFGHINKIDEDYKFEQEVAEEQGFKTCLFNYDDFVNGVKIKLNINNNNELVYHTAVYRGWMLKPIDYDRFFNELKSLGYYLINSNIEYINTHYFINSYELLKGLTPKTLWYEEGQQINWNEVRQNFDKFIVKDYVKSVKGFDFPEYLESSMTDEELNSYIYKFKQLRGNLYTGGIVLKQYIELDKKKEHTHEFRAFYLKGKMITIYANSDNKEDKIPYEMVNLYTLKFALKSNFYTVDIARLSNGEYIVIEIGDGQVSGITSKKEAEKIYKALGEL